MTDFDVVRDHKSLFMIRKEIVTKNISGFESGVDVMSAKDYFDDAQMDKVREIRDRKLKGAELRDYKGL